MAKRNVALDRSARAERDGMGVSKCRRWFRKQSRRKGAHCAHVSRYTVESLRGLGCVGAD